MHQYQPIIESLLEKLKNIFSLSLSTIANISFPVAHKTFITQMRVRQHVWKKSRRGKQTFMALFMMSYMEKAQLLRHKTGQTYCDIQPPQIKICLTFMNTFNTLLQPEAFLLHQTCFHTKTYETFRYH